MWSLCACETMTASSAGVKRELTVGAVGIDSVGIEQPAVEQDPPGIDLQQVSAARDRSGRAVERDSQPNNLPTIDSAPAMRQRHAACAMLGNAIANAPGQSSLSQPALTRRRTADVRHGPHFQLSFVNVNNSIMPGTCDGFKPENYSIVRATETAVDRSPCAASMIIREPKIE